MVGNAEWVTIDELVADAQAIGFPATSRLITDWVSLGLLDHPKRRSKGQGRGQEKGIWPPNQRRLFGELVRQRPALKQITPLFNLPVYLWLVWGDGYVPLSQARRALSSWAGAANPRPWRQCVITAKQVLAELDHPDAQPGDRKALIDGVAAVGYTGTLNQEALLAAAERVADPNHVGAS